MNKKLIFVIILLLLILLPSICFNFKEGYEDINQSVNDISKNINNIEVPANFMPTHPWTSKQKTGLKILDSPPEQYIYKKDDDYLKMMDDSSSRFNSSFTCRPSITGIFTDCGPYSFNACGPINSSYDIKNMKSNNHKHHKKHRHHRNHRNHDEDNNSILKANCKTCNFYNYNYIHNNFKDNKLSRKH